MKNVLIIFAAVSIFLMNTYAQTPKDLAQIWEKQHVSKLQPSQVRHKDLQKYLEQLKGFGLKVEEVGRSYANREIYQIEWGKGTTKVFMWSQMHGDEPTATSALIDMFALLQENRDKDWVKKLENTLTIRAVPMLNPDGAELYQRRNLQFIDINRDARALETPEGRLLKKLRDEWSPNIGFNLHNQNSLTTVGNTNKQATISLLAVSGNAEGKSNEGHLRNKRLCTLIVDALNQFIKGHIGRYDDTYNPRAFGDMISAWGTPVILIETGAFHGKDEMFLIKLNFIAYLSALQAIVDGSEKKANPKIYDQLPFNETGNLFNVIFRKANIINFNETTEPFTADVAINAERRRSGENAPTFVQEIGDLSVFSGLNEYDASDFYLVQKKGLLRTGASGEFFFYKKTRKIDWKVKDLEKAFPPDAVFSNGKWTKGEKLLSKKS
ncbi:MAG: peptidase M14 [Acidobacteria bacterium]|nr:peptidase M14 [Acidobacteriota bacterium]MCA1637753.1 peptidase M14 [Acidobacteriota bacterium]